MTMALKKSAEGAGRNLYLLIDGAQVDAPMLIYSYDDCPGFEQLYRQTPHQSALEVSPCLVQPSDTSRLWEQESVWRSAGVAVESDADIQTLAEHFRSLISVRLPDQTFAYLRFYAPTQVDDLLSAFTPNERIQFSGPVRKWHYFRPGSGWEALEIDILERRHEAREEGWFQLTDAHIQTISARKEAKFIRTLVNNAGLPLTPENENHIRVLVDQGRRYGFRTEAELAIYTEMATCYPEAINQPCAQTILANKGRPAYERLAELDHLMVQGGA